MKNRNINAEGEGAIPSVMPHRGLRQMLVAALVCLLLATLVWFCVMNAEDTDFIPVSVEAPRDGYTYTLSAEGIEVTGSVAALRDLSNIGVVIPAHVPAEYHLTAEDLVLPEGVRVSGELHLTLTVSVN